MMGMVYLSATSAQSAAVGTGRQCRRPPAWCKWMTARSHFDCITARIDEIEGGLRGGYVATDQRQVWVILLIFSMVLSTDEE